MNFNIIGIFQTSITFTSIIPVTLKVLFALWKNSLFLTVYPIDFLFWPKLFIRCAGSVSLSLCVEILVLSEAESAHWIINDSYKYVS